FRPSNGRCVRTERSRWPKSVSASVRGIGVADTSRRSGRSPFAQRRKRCFTPNLCCSSTTTAARSRKRVAVATVVVEVGIDVPDATLAVVLGADRFGLSQLHQIRGRVGRRGAPAGCLLVATDPGEATKARLDAFAATDDGFRLAEMDLELRGPG